MTRARDVANIDGILTTKGDIYAATAAATPARLGVGSNGETLVADSSATTGLRYQGNWAAGKNKCLNSDFSIWQRGTSFAGNVYTADRWTTQTNKTLTVSRQSFTVGTAPVAGYEGTFFLRQTYSADGSFGALQTKLEDVRLFAGQTITLSYWAKADATYSNTPSVSQNFGSGGSDGVGTNGTTHNITTSWTRYSSVITVPSISGKTIGTSSFFMLQPILIESAGARTIDIWGVQVEVGNTATAFQTATGTLQGELAACQRYYAKSYPQGTTVPTNSSEGVQRIIAGSYSPAAGDIYSTINFPVVMRTAPTVTVYSSSNSVAGMMSNNQGTSLAANSAVVLQVTDRQGGIYNNSGGSLGPQNGGFHYHYAASAEL
jgi:hypothetical protein